jgi:hypothetical protein
MFHDGVLALAPAFTSLLAAKMTWRHLGFQAHPFPALSSLSPNPLGISTRPAPTAQMTREDRNGPRCSNSWRPWDGPLQSGDERAPWQDHTIPSDEHDRFRAGAAERSSFITHRSLADYDHDMGLPNSRPHTPESKGEAFNNPNLIPVITRRSQTVGASGRVWQEERLPQIWHPSVDELIRRTEHAYDLVLNYERDSHGGQRWIPEDIAKIQKIGKHLHPDAFALRCRQRDIAEQGDRDKVMMQRIKKEANSLKLLCERIQQAISKYEQKCEFELLRHGVYAQDEDGNFYKPTAPQHYLDEGGYLQNAPASYTEHEEYYHSYEEYHRHAQSLPSSDRYTSRPQQSNRKFDATSQTILPTRTKPKSSHPEVEVRRRSPRVDRVRDSRISKSQKHPQPSKAHPPAPPHHKVPANPLSSLTPPLFSSVSSLL